MLSRVHLTGRVLHPSVQLCILCHNPLLTHYNQSNTGLMHGARMRELMTLWSRLQINRVALVGGNHTSSRFCTR
ncbi:hypothetical protein RIF29_11986 [Crotalaria pallida]|uniref:Uncharacterized protein n=1 Tax=Crotalaria pallida TaxID=3830 RepID=A0AAN9IMS3_CROPI